MLIVADFARPNFAATTITKLLPLVYQTENQYVGSFVSTSEGIIAVASGMGTFAFIQQGSGFVPVSGVLPNSTTSPFPQVLSSDVILSDYDIYLKSSVLAGSPCLLWAQLFLQTGGNTFYHLGTLETPTGIYGQFVYADQWLAAGTYRRSATKGRPASGTNAIYLYQYNTNQKNFTYIKTLDSPEAHVGRIVANSGKLIVCLEYARFNSAAHSKTGC